MRGGEPRAVQVGELVGVELDGETACACGGEYAGSLRRGERDPFAKGIDRVGQR